VFGRGDTKEERTVYVSTNVVGVQMVGGVVALDTRDLLE
jgi:hypothetical protein